MADNSMLILICLTTVIGVIFIIFTHFSSRYRERLNSSGVSSSLSNPRELMPETKRQYDRLNLKWPVSLEALGGTIGAQTINISISGAFIAVQQPLQVGERFTIILDIPEHQKITMEGQVVWNNSNFPDDKIISRGMGIRFVGTSNENRDTLNRILLASQADNEDTEENFLKEKLKKTLEAI